MSRRSPRSPAEPRPDDPEALPAIDDPAMDDGDDQVQPVDEPDALDVAGDTALLGAYALGALTPEERAAVEERLAASPALQDELCRLIPVAALLREATDALPSAADVPTPTDAAAGVPASRGPAPMNVAAGVPARSTPPTDREIQDAVDQAPEADPTRSHEDDPPPPEVADDQVAVDNSAGEPTGAEAPSPVRVEAAPGSLSSRPAGRRARAAPVGAQAQPRPARTMVAGWPLSWIAASLTTLVAVGAVLWALALVDRVDTRQGEVDALESELSELRARGDAVVVTLIPAEGGPAGVDGVVVVVPSEGSLIVRVGGLPASADGRVYQIWFQDAAEVPEGRWVVGPVFRVGEGGTALVELPAAAPDFTRLAISEESSPGSDAPTGAFLLEGTVMVVEAE